MLLRWLIIITVKYLSQKERTNCYLLRESYNSELRCKDVGVMKDTERISDMWECEIMRGFGL